MRRTRLGRCVQPLHALQAHKLTRDKLLMKLAAARHDAGRVASAIKDTVPEPVQDATAATVGFEFRLDRATLQHIGRRNVSMTLRHPGTLI